MTKFNMANFTNDLLHGIARAIVADQCPLCRHAIMEKNPPKWKGEPVHSLCLEDLIGEHRDPYPDLPDQEDPENAL